MSFEGFEDITGKWLLVRDEGLDEYLEYNGINIVKRKLARTFKTTMELIKIDDKRVRIITTGAKNWDTHINIDELNEEVDPFDNEIVFRANWDSANKVLKTDNNPKNGSKTRRTIVERKLTVDGELLQEITLPDDNMVCKRYFKREKA